MKGFFSAVFLVLSSLSIASAQITAPANHRFEISPFGGFETGSSAPINIPISPITGIPATTIDKTGVKKGVSFGTFLDYNITPQFQGEFFWVRNPTKFTQHDFTLDQTFEVGSADVDQYQFGVLFHLTPADRAFRPYVAGSLGFTHNTNGSTSSIAGDTAFSFSVGGGVKHFVARHFGFRGDIRYLPTFASTVHGLVCDPFGNCFTADQHKYFNRMNLVGGIVFAF